MAIIEDRKGASFSVDDDDWSRLQRYTWHVVRPDGRKCYVRSHIRDESGKQRTVYLHRLVMNAGVGQEVDHINGDGLDNRKENLRFATRQENCRNSPKRAGTLSQFKGVYRDPKSGRWRAYIRVNYRMIWLGYFESERDAALAADSAVRETYGEFGRFNFPQGNEQPARVAIERETA